MRKWLEQNGFRCWSWFSIEIIYTTYNVIEMTKFSVCHKWSHAQGHYRLFLWPKVFAALSNGMHEIRDEILIDLLVLVPLV